jgi:hypothetical protein
MLRWFLLSFWKKMAVSIFLTSRTEPVRVSESSENLCFITLRHHQNMGTRLTTNRVQSLKTYIILLYSSLSVIIYI